MAENNDRDFDISGEEVWEPTEEQKAAQERQQRQHDILSRIVDSYFPDKDFYQIVADQDDVARETLNDEQREYAVRLMRGYEYAKQNLIESMVQENVPDEELQPLAQRVYAMVETLSPDGQVDIDSALGWSGALVSPEKSTAYFSLAQSWKERLLANTDPSQAKKRIGDLKLLIADISGHNRSPRVERSVEEINDLAQSFIELYEYGYSLPEGSNDKIASEIIYAAQKNGLNWHSTEQVRRLTRLFQETVETTDKAAFKTFIINICKYSRQHQLSEEARVGLENKLLPAIERNDPQVEALQKETNMWGMHQGDFGLGDFLCHSYACKVDPRHLNELYMVARTIPATSLNRMEQNRFDGLSLSFSFGILRDFIHDERPYVHDVINAMVKYYDTGDRSELVSVIQKTDYLKQERSRQQILDRAQYDMVVQERIGDRSAQYVNTTAINILRRLQTNTEPVEEHPPVTSDTSFNQFMNEVDGSAGNIAREQLGQALSHLNEQLVREMQNGEIGIEPNYVLAIGWLEHQGFRVLQGLTYEDQIGLFKQEWFKNILKFQELTYSATDFNETDFDSFINQLQNAPTYKEGHRLLLERTVKRIGTLAKEYEQSGHEERRDALWSGNIAHELIGLVDLREAQTAYGKKHRAEATTPVDRRITGD